MKTLSHKLASLEAALEYQKIITIVGQHEVWETYLIDILQVKKDNHEFEFVHNCLL